MKNTLDYSPSVKQLIDSVFETYSDSNTTPNAVKKKTISHELFESDNQFLLKLYVPGYSKEELEIKVEEGKLIVSSEIKTKTPEGYKLVRSSYVQGGIYKAFKLDEKVDVDHIKADLSNGVLALSLPKATKEVKKVITIN